MIRRATINDVPSINGLITQHAERGLMLFRSMADLYEKVRQFVVCEEEGEILGCCALEIVWRDLAEVKSLAVSSSAHGRGIGRSLVEAVEQEAVQLGLDRVFALTREEGFFSRLGYEIVPKESLPHKVWSDCVKCPRLHNCDEVAVYKPLSDAGRAQQDEANERASRPARPPDASDPTFHIFQD